MREGEDGGKWISAEVKKGNKRKNRKNEKKEGDGGMRGEYHEDSENEYVGIDMTRFPYLSFCYFPSPCAFLSAFPSSPFCQSDSRDPYPNYLPLIDPNNDINSRSGNENQDILSLESSKVDLVLEVVDANLDIGDLVACLDGSG